MAARQSSRAGQSQAVDLSGLLPGIEWRLRANCRDFIGDWANAIAQNELAARRRPKQNAQNSSSSFGVAVALLELVHAAANIGNLLLAGVERMALGADFDLQIVANGRTRLERVAAAAGDVDFGVTGMNFSFHANLESPARVLKVGPASKMGAKCTQIKSARQARENLVRV
jgi:hypothetical protein